MRCYKNQSRICPKRYRIFSQLHENSVELISFTLGNHENGR
jgi:hypothetical protein